MDTAADIADLRARLNAAEARAEAAEADLAQTAADLAQAKAEASSTEAMIAHLTLQIEKMRRALYGQKSERKERLLEQMELNLEDLQATATEDDLAAEQAAPTTTVQSFTRRKPSRKPFPEHLPRERVVIPAPETCECCGSDHIAKLGETVTETLEVIPRPGRS